MISKLRVTGCFGILTLLLAEASIAQVQQQSCTLTPIVLSGRFPNQLSFGSQKIATDTTIKFEFFATSAGFAKIVRSEETILISLNEQVSAAIDAADKKLPKNECNSFARVSGKTIGVSGSLYSISANVSASFSQCTPKQVPCPRINDFSKEVRPHFAVDLGEPDGTVSTAQFDLSQFNPPIKPPSFPPLRPPFEPGRTPDVPVKMCDVPGAPKVIVPIGSGTATISYLLRGQVLNNQPTVSSTHAEQFRLDDRTQFLSGLLGPSSMLTNLSLDAGLSALLSKNLGVVPSRIKLPNSPIEHDLEWSTTSAQFATRPYQGVQAVAFIVTREYEAATPVACLLRRQLTNKV